MKIIVSILMIFVFYSLTLNAYDKRGLNAYKKLCVQCHGGPFAGAGMHTTDEWDEMVQNSKTPLYDLHKNVPDAIEKFESSLSKKRKKYLFKFLANNASDAGTVPGCDGNYCGQD